MNKYTMWASGMLNISKQGDVRYIGTEHGAEEDREQAETLNEKQRRTKVRQV